MSYRFEKNQNGQQDLVIDGWEDGIAVSPYKGLANIKNLNIKYYEGITYVNYKRLAATMNTSALGRPQYSCKSPAGLIYISDDTAGGGIIWKQDAVNGSSFSPLTGASNTSPLIGLAFWNNYLFVFRTNGVIEICGDGTGDSGVTSSNWNTGSGTTGVWPIAASATIVRTATGAAGDTSGTLSSYTDAKGDSRSAWNGPTGYYLATFAGVSNQEVTMLLTQGSTAMTWTPGLNSTPSGPNCIVRPQPNLYTPSTRYAIIAQNDGNLYFCNANGVGSFQSIPNQNMVKGNMKTYQFYAQILALPQTEDLKWLSELRNNLIVAGRQTLYPWDFFSPNWDTPIPMDEQVSKMINILNNIYIFAGNKGNIYISNGYSVSRFTKIPDIIAGVIDPSWLTGGLMQHRQKLYFQTLGANVSGTNLFQGILSVDLDTGAINVENENSSAVNSGSGAAGLLIDVSDTSIAYDKYYSAGDAAVNFVDYNDTTLYSNDEPLIETDLIPIGTFLQPKSFQNMEFKLDQPLQTGDSITVYGRISLSDSYTLIGTTTTAVLSNILEPFTLEKLQWIQFKITMKCNSSVGSSSRVRLREIRVR